MNRITEQSQRAGALVRRYREGLELTQDELARACGGSPSRDHIQQLEQGRILVPRPDTFNALRRVLKFPGWEYFETLGYDLGCSQDGILPALQVTIQQMPESKQRALLGVAKTLS